MADEDRVLMRQLTAKVQRALGARRAGAPAAWSGLGMSGVIGWSVALPTLAGGLIGLWLDKRYPGHRSWTLTLLMTGLILGCATAGYWVAQQSAVLHPRLADEPKRDDHNG